MKKIFFLLLMTWSVFTFAEDTRYRVDLAYFQDANESFSINDLPVLDFLPFTDQLRLGLQKGNTWVRVGLIPEPDGALLTSMETKKPLVLVVAPFYLNELNFFESVNGQWQGQVGGSMHAKRYKNCPIDAHCFELSGFKGGRSQYFLKINAFRARLVSAEVMPEEQLQSLSSRRMMGIVASFTLTLTLLFSAMVFWVLEPTRLIFAYCVFQTSIIVNNSFSSGLIAYWFDGSTFEAMSNMGNYFIALRTLIAVLLGVVLISRFKPNAIYFKASFALILACCVSAMLLFLGQDWLAAWLLIAVAIALPLVNIWGSMRLQIEMPTKRVFQVCWGGFFVLVIFEFLNSFGGLGLGNQVNLIQSNREVRVTGLLFGVGMLMMVLVHKKTKLKLKTIQESQKLELAAEKERLEHLQLQEQMALIDMLTHELKTPLSTIKFAVSSLRKPELALVDSVERLHNIDVSVRRMDVLIEHVAMSNQIERHDHSVEFKIVDATEFMNDVLQEYQSLNRNHLEIEDGAYFHAPPLFLNLIVENLVNNAYKYALNGNIKIKISIHPDTHTCFQISNLVSADTHPDESRLFERYYRHSHFQNVSGMGIGLSLVDSAAKKINATVHYQKQDHVVTFEVRFPL